MPRANAAIIQHQSTAKRGLATQATMKKVKIEKNNSSTLNEEEEVNPRATGKSKKMPAAEEEAVDKV